MDTRTHGLLIDIDGVLVVSWRPVPGASQALAELRDSGMPIRFATNATSRSRAEIAATLTAVGMPVGPEEIVNAPTAAAAHLREHHRGARCLLVNEGDLRPDLAGIQLVDRPPFDVVIIGGAGPSFTYRTLNRAFQAVHGGAALIAMHRSLMWRTFEGIQLDSGGFVRAIEDATGVEATVIGKPSPTFFATAARELGLPPGQITMVGDDARNDVLAAQEAGMRGVLVRTGKFTPRDLDDLPREPDAAIDSLRDLLVVAAH